MEFPFDVNYLLPYDVTILNGDFRVLNHGQTIRIFASEKLTLIIDAMGDASFKAQGLAGPVTTARKFRQADHRLYIIKKSQSHNFLGAVVGILKVGFKHLYIYDSNGQVYERTPLCVLDFYVHESQQRLGYGKRLFDTMLEFEKCLPHQLAIDRPSNKCLAFLHKHYQLTCPVHQVNNFVVFPAFFPLKTKTINTSEDEFHSWLFSSSPRRPFSEQIVTNRDENDFFTHHRRGTSLMRTASMFTERSPISSSLNLSNGSTYQPSFDRESTKTIYAYPNSARQAPIIENSSSWRLFGFHRLLN